MANVCGEAMEFFDDSFFLTVLLSKVVMKSAIIDISSATTSGFVAGVAGDLTTVGLLTLVFIEVWVVDDATFD